MTNGSKKHPDENEVRRRVQELSLVEADDGFRRRLRSEFVSGEIETATQSAPVEERHRIAWRRWLVPALAAAALLVAMVLLNAGPELRVAEVSGSGEVLVDGRGVSVDDVELLEAAIRPGVEIETPPEALIDVLAEDVTLFEIAGGTRMSIPKMPGRWFGREVACRLSHGEVRIKTGDRFSGSKLRVVTPEGIVEIAGTLLSIQRDETGTCVCVLEGVAYVGVDESDMEPIEPGYRKVMPADGAAKIIPVKEMHRDGVLDFDRRVGERIR